MKMRKGLLSTVVRSVATAFKGNVPATQAPAGLSSGGWWGPIRESFAGAWQQASVVPDPTHTLLAYSATYACITMIANDIAKLRPKLMVLDQGVWKETTSPAFSPVLRKPNHFQTRTQFLHQWITSKLIHGNSYILKERDSRGVVVALYVLDARLVKPLVADSGDVFYSVGTDRLIGRAASFVVPQAEIIHDRAVCFFHPLIGIPPLYACGISATQGNRIQANSARFFENMSRPSGQLTAPGTITDETAKRLKSEFEANFSGTNIGRLLVTGDGLKYEAMVIPAQQAQLIEQLRWTVEDISRAFHVPLFKIASDAGEKFANIAAKNQDYYAQTLQALIEDVEILLDEGLGLANGGPQQFGVELDLEGLLRMDPTQRAERTKTLVGAGVLSPDEARSTESLAPLPGAIGQIPFMQSQYQPLDVLAAPRLLAALDRRLAEVEREFLQ
jgi:HK97 family phage portal protein